MGKIVHRLFLGIVFTFLVAAGYAETHRILKVVVKADGTLFADGASCTLDELARQLDELREHKGVVWFYRVVVDGREHPNAKAAMRLIGGSKVPFTQAQKEDFSDVKKRLASENRPMKEKPREIEPTSKTGNPLDRVEKSSVNRTDH